MRKAGIVLIAVMMCAGYSFGQSGLPQWKVIKEFHVKGQTNALGPITLFTPAKDGLYRLSALMAGHGPIPQNNNPNYVAD